MEDLQPSPQRSPSQNTEAKNKKAMNMDPEKQISQLTHNMFLSFEYSFNMWPLFGFPELKLSSKHIKQSTRTMHVYDQEMQKKYELDKSEIIMLLSLTHLLHNPISAKEKKIIFTFCRYPTHIKLSYKNRILGLR